VAAHDGGQARGHMLAHRALALQVPPRRGRLRRRRANTTRKTQKTPPVR
jgi:hypothetical protein